MMEYDRVDDETYERFQELRLETLERERDLAEVCAELSDSTFGPFMRLYVRMIPLARRILPARQAFTRAIDEIADRYGLRARELPQMVPIGGTASGMSLFEALAKFLAATDHDQKGMGE